MLNEISPGQELGRYELLIPVAQGGMAMVWAARLKGSRGFQKLVAIKTMLPSMIDDPSFQRMFIDEATLASKVRHPHVIEILDVGEHDQIPYLVMEWVEGEPLNVLMHHAAKRGGVPQALAVAIGLQTCRGLHAAHELRDESGALYGLVHRDVTPQNVLVTYDGVVKVVDFGVAKATRRLAAETEVGQLKGKIAYMSPEQLQGDPIDRRSDVFAVGILLYMLTTGQHPFKGDDQLATIRNICAPQAAKPPRKVVAGYNPALEEVVMQALAKEPDKRFASANDMFKALRSVATPSTDEELGDFMKGVMSERLDKRRAALKAALAAADGESVSSLPASYRAESYSTDDVMTVIERDPRAIDGALAVEAELSLSGVGAPPRGPNAGSGFGRPLALLMTFAVVLAVVAVSLFVMTRSAGLEVDAPANATSSDAEPRELPSPKDEEPSVVATVEPSIDVRELPEETHEDVPAQSAGTRSRARPRKRAPAPPAEGSAEPEPPQKRHISPVRSPGF